MTCQIDFFLATQGSEKGVQKNGYGNSIPIFLYTRRISLLHDHFSRFPGQIPKVGGKHAHLQYAKSRE